MNRLFLVGTFVGTGLIAGCASAPLHSEPSEAAGPVGPRPAFVVSAVDIDEVQLAARPGGWVTAVTFAGETKIGDEVVWPGRVGEGQSRREGIALTLVGPSGDVEGLVQLTVDDPRYYPSDARLKTIWASALSVAPSGEIAFAFMTGYQREGDRTRYGKAVLQRRGPDGSLIDEVVLGSEMGGVEVTDIEWLPKHGWVFVTQFYKSLMLEGQSTLSADWAAAAIHRWSDGEPEHVELLPGAAELTQLAVASSDDVIAAGFFLSSMTVGDTSVRLGDREARAFATRVGVADGEVQWFQSYVEQSDTRIPTIGEVVGGEIIVGNVNRPRREGGLVGQYLIVSAADGRVLRTDDRGDRPYFFESVSPRMVANSLVVDESDGVGNIRWSSKVPVPEALSPFVPDSRAARSGDKIACVVVGDLRGAGLRQAEVVVIDAGPQ